VWKFCILGLTVYGKALKQLQLVALYCTSVKHSVCSGFVSRCIDDVARPDILAISLGSLQKDWGILFLSHSRSLSVTCLLHAFNNLVSSATLTRIRQGSWMTALASFLCNCVAAFQLSQCALDSSIVGLITAFTCDRALMITYCDMYSPLQYTVRAL
jgi:hypothetical protein